MERIRPRTLSGFMELLPQKQQKLLGIVGFQKMVTLLEHAAQLTAVFRRAAADEDGIMLIHGKASLFSLLKILYMEKEGMSRCFSSAFLADVTFLFCQNCSICSLFTGWICAMM